MQTWSIWSINSPDDVVGISFDCPLLQLVSRSVHICDILSAKKTFAKVPPNQWATPLYTINVDLLALGMF